MESNTGRSVPQAYEYEKDGSQESENESQDEKQLGAKVLSLAHFELGKSIVESSFKKARKNGEVLPGKNDERRNYSYLKRLYGIVENMATKGNKNFGRRLSRATCWYGMIIFLNRIGTLRGRNCAIMVMAITS